MPAAGGAPAHDVIICGPAERKTLAAADANKGASEQRGDAPPASPALDCVHLSTLRADARRN